jgi:hypothetical protein
MCEKLEARTLEALEQVAANALPQFKSDQCANFFAHAGAAIVARLVASAAQTCGR